MAEIILLSSQGKVAKASSLHDTSKIQNDFQIIRKVNSLSLIRFLRLISDYNERFLRRSLCSKISFVIKRRIPKQLRDIFHIKRKIKINCPLSTIQYILSSPPPHRFPRLSPNEPYKQNMMIAFIHQELLTNAGRRQSIVIGTGRRRRARTLFSRFCSPRCTEGSHGF